MSILLIAFDIATDGGADKALSGAIRALGSRWARPLASLWYVETSASVAEIEAALAPLIGEEDGLLVQEVIGEAALANTMLRWTRGSMLAPVAVLAAAGSQHRPWQPRLVPVGLVPAGGHLPNSETAVAAAA
jgi:hypothetical protein